MANPLLMAEIFDNINEGIYILNRKGDYIYCNNAFLKMVGATREEALSLNAFQLIPEGAYDFGYVNNGMMTMPAMALILVGCVIWVHRAYIYKEEK